MVLVEMMDPNIKKLAIAFLLLVTKLRLYFQAYVIIVMTSYLLWQVLHKANTSGRLMRLLVEFEEFRIKY